MMTEPRHEATDLLEQLQRLAPELLNFLRRRATNSEDAADMLAECYAVVWRRRRVIPDDESEARMWMYGVANKVLSNWRRSERRRDALVQRLRDMLPTQGEPAELPEVADAVARLPSNQAALIRLVHWESFSIVDAATILGVSESTARGRYQRARTSLASDPEILGLRVETKFK